MAGAAGIGLALPAGAGDSVQIQTGDVALFYRVYDGAVGAPTGDALQRDYIDAGSEGVRQFVPHRIISGAALAETVHANKAVYDQARACVDALPKVKTKLRTAFRKLSRLDPQASFPPVTILIGRNNSGGTTGKAGVLIGLEVVCRSSGMHPDLSDCCTI